MVKLRELTHFLVNRLLVQPEQFDSWAEQVSLLLYWKPTEQGLHMGDMRYRAIINLERFGDSPARLMALVGSWLEVNDPERDSQDLPPPVFEIDQMDSDLADVELQLEFTEGLHLSESADGEIEAFGKHWALIPFDLWVAEQGDVIDDRSKA